MSDQHANVSTDLTAPKETVPAAPWWLTAVSQWGREWGRGRVQPPSPETIRLLTKLEIGRDDPWVYLTSDGPVSPDHALLRVDDGGAPRHFPLNQDHLPKWDGYSFELIGVRKRRGHMMLGQWQPWGGLDLDVRFMRIRYQQSPLSVEYVASEREEADAAIRGVFLPHMADDRKKAWAGRDLLWEKLQRGRPEGPRKGSDTEYWLGRVDAHGGIKVGDPGERAARAEYYNDVPRGPDRYDWWDDNILRTLRGRKHRQ